MFISFKFLKWDILKMQPLKELNCYLKFLACVHYFSSLEVATSAELVFKKGDFD